MRLLLFAAYLVPSRSRAQAPKLAETYRTLVVFGAVERYFPAY